VTEGWSEEWWIRLSEANPLTTSGGRSFLRKGGCLRVPTGDGNVIIIWPYAKERRDVRRDDGRRKEGWGKRGEEARRKRR
jgi:hypothetical protein